MLTQQDTSEMARYALERIPVLPSTMHCEMPWIKPQGKTKIGIINSLGDRRDIASVTPLGKLLNDTDNEITLAAAAALGKIADANAAEKLGKRLEAGIRPNARPHSRCVPELRLWPSRFRE